MSLSRNLGRAISIAAIALAVPAIGQIKTAADGVTEIAEAARPVDEGVPEVAVYQLQKLVTGLSGADAIKAKEKLAEALIAARRSSDAFRLLDEPVLLEHAASNRLAVIASAMSARQWVRTFNRCLLRCGARAQHAPDMTLASVQAGP